MGNRTGDFGSRLPACVVGVGISIELLACYPKMLFFEQSYKYRVSGATVACIIVGGREGFVKYHSCRRGLLGAVDTALTQPRLAVRVNARRELTRTRLS